jgi:hypothetical protein
MRSLRRWSVRHARGLESLYRGFERWAALVAPLARRVGLQRLERPVAAVERLAKGAFFDCRMCGQCVLSSTGMSCPMNCPKSLRNGPCGGVRADGRCEVVASMPCVWLLAWEGSARMRDAEAVRRIQPPLDHRAIGTSSWIKVLDAAGRKPGEAR